MQIKFPLCVLFTAALVCVSACDKNPVPPTDAGGPSPSATSTPAPQPDVPVKAPQTESKDERVATDSVSTPDVAPAPDAAPQILVAVRDKPVDLLPLIDPVRDAIVGTWRIEDGVLVSPTARHARIELPCTVPEEFTFVVRVERKSENGLLVLGLPVLNVQPFALVAGGPAGYSGMARIDGRIRPAQLYSGDAIERGSEHLFECFVHRDGILLKGDGRLLFDWRGQRTQLSGDRNWSAKNAGRPFVGVHESEFRITKIEIRPGAEVPPPAATADNSKDVAKVPAPAATSKPAVQGAAVAKLPVPDMQAQKIAEKLVADSHRLELARAKTTEQKTELARRLAGQAAGTGDGAAVKWALFQQARNLAVQAVDVPLAREITDEIGAAFTVDARAILIEVLNGLAEAVGRPADGRPVVDAILAEVAAAIRNEEFATVAILANAATTAATRARDAELRNRTRDRVAGIRTIQQFWESSQQARKTLAKDGKNPAANHALGAYLCFVRHDWKAGPAHLANGYDTTLQEVARLEMGQQTNAEQRLKLADAWYAAAAPRKGFEQTAMQQRAVEWYRAALRDLQGNEKERAEKRIKEISTADEE